MEKVVDKMMYHFHKPYVKADKWKVDNEIIVDDNYNSYFISKCLYENETGIPNKDGRLDSYVNAVQNVLDNSSKEYLLELIKNEEDFLKKADYLLHLLKISQGFAHNTMISNRELGLEDYRIKNCPELPSRLHSMWVCSHKQLNYWKKTLNLGCELYLLSLTGDLFKTTPIYLPNGNYGRASVEEWADKYWNPPLDRDESKDEYLFHGKAKILRKVFM